MSNNFESIDIIGIDELAHLCLVLCNLVNIHIFFMDRSIDFQLW
jgi:hypothetical protein